MVGRSLAIFRYLIALASWRSLVRAICLLCFSVSTNACIVVGGGPISTDAETLDIEQSWQQLIEPIYTDYCAGCHSSETSLGGRDLSNVSAWSDATLADLIRRRFVSDQTMPPASSPQPSDGERETVRRWIDENVSP